MLCYPLPPRLPTNPYLDQLYGPMGDMGILIRRDRPRRALPALLLGRGPRILHLHFFDELTQRPGALPTAARSLAFLGLLAALRARGVRLVWTAHNLEPHELHRPAWASLVYRRVARWSDAAIAHGAAARELVLERYGPSRCVVIPQGGYTGLYGPRRDRAASRVALGLPASGPLTLCFGALRPYKNVEGLIDAFAALPADERGHLLIAGVAKDPAYAALLRERAAPVPGVLLRERFIPDAELPVHLAAADLVALPYRRALTSAILLMALSYGRPVVAPALPPIAELVAEGREGFLFAPGDDASLAMALGRALAHPDLDALGEAAYALALRYDWAESARLTAELYRSVAYGRRA